MADVIHDRLLKVIDWTPTQINSLTASTPAAIRTPVHFPTDKMCLEKFWPTVGKFKQEDVTIAWIANSMELARLRLSENLRSEIAANSTLEVEGDPEPLDFDESGNLHNLMEAAMVGH
jgi:hypothetical protein